MAELAAGAVSSLLGVIRNETLLLGGVRDDVQFIKEEMESMNSFLLHLARTAPPSGEHDEQVRTWMNQVRLLAQDCNNCIDLYLYRGNPDIQRTRGKIRRYLWWAYWFLHKLLAQHRAAVQLGQLKERARDVGERRLRYGVEVPAKRTPHVDGQTAGVAATPSLWAQAVAPAAAGAHAAEDDEEDGEDELPVAAMASGSNRSLTATYHSGRRSYFEPPTLDDYVKAKLLEWVYQLPCGAVVTLSISIVAPDGDQEALALVHETLRNLRCYQRCVSVDIPTVHLNFEPLRPTDVLYYILREIKLKDSQSQSHEQGTDHSNENKGLDSLDVFFRKISIQYEKQKDLDQINKRDEVMKIYKRLDKIKSDTLVRSLEGLEQNKVVDQLDLEVLLQVLFQSAATVVSQQGQLKNKYIHKLHERDDKMITKIAWKFKEYMEADQEGGGGAEGRQHQGEEQGGRVLAVRGHEEGKREENEAPAAVVTGGGGEQREGKAIVGGAGHEEGEATTRVGHEGEAKEKQEATGIGGGQELGQGEETTGVGHEEGVVEEKQELAATAAEEGGGGGGGKEQEGIQLHETQYERILCEVFPKTSISKPHAHQQDRLAVEQARTTTFGEDPIKRMIQEAKKEILRELQEGSYDRNPKIGEHSNLGQNTEDIFKEIEQKMDKIRQEFEEQLQIKGLVDRIKDHLKGDCPLFILKVDEMIDVPRWEDIRNALSLLQCSADALIITTKKDTQQAKEYCFPSREPIEYSPMGLYYDTVLEHTSQKRNEDSISTPEIFRGILEVCEPYEFCMKIFTHALYANPKKSNEDLIKLYNTLQASPRSFHILVKMMFKFSYSDLPKEYKSCLLYLAIFPLGQKIKRSTLIGRWVSEGLIFNEDWASSVRRANRCFDALINRWLLYPADIGTTGKVKSCVVGDIIHGLITRIAKKQHIVEPRLSRHLARHFSIFNDLQLRSSDKIENFFQRLSKSSRVLMLKVLDVEGCKCFGGKNQRYLKDICAKMPLLKYLSLRRTNITQLPSEINNLHELEVLDIRQTKVPKYATRHLLLLKLKRLLAGHIDQSAHSCETGTAIRADKSASSVQIPHKIGKMVHLEVLSNVKPKHSRDLKDIGKIWQLRKLGVIIDYNNDHIRNLLLAINDQHEYLRSLSVTLPIARHEDISSSRELPDDIVSCLQQHPNFLESLNISGSTLTGHLLPLFAKDVNNVLGKVTLSRTSLNHNYLKVLGNLPKLRCVKLQYIEFTEVVLTFNEEEFKYLKYLLVERSNLTEITFKNRATPELEKIVLSFTKIASIIGVDRLKKLEELELNNNDNARLLSSFADAEQIVELTLRGTLLAQDDLEILRKKPKLRSLKLLDMSVSGIDGLTNQITFKNDDFLKLNQLDVRCSTITDVVFTAGSAPKLEKIIWSVTSLSGINNLPRLKELEFHGDLVSDEVREAIKGHNIRLNLKQAKPENQDQAIEDAPKEDAAIRFRFCCNQV
ncbi:hypothetical protein ACP4OV_016528 [Aristida adscensionis]